MNTQPIKKMTSYERVMNRMEGKPVDKIPNMNITMAFAAHFAGATYKEFCTNYKVLVESKIAVSEEFGVDIVSAISDPMREAHGFGAKVIIPEDDVPFCKEYLIADLSNINNLNPTNPLDNERMLDRVRAIELFKASVGKRYPIVGWVEGALADATDLRDISQVMMDLMLNPEPIVDLFEKIYEQQKAFAKVQIDAGADFVGIGNAAASLIGPQLYEQFCLEYDKRIIKDIHDMGAKAKLHICGRTQPLYELLVKTEADIFDVDHVNDFNLAINTFKGTKTLANGNFDPVTDMMSASEEHVVNAVKKCISVSDERTMISAGCEIPSSTPYENMKAMNETLYIK